jgi:hypothetical protein
MSPLLHSGKVQPRITVTNTPKLLQYGINYDVKNVYGAGPLNGDSLPDPIHLLSTYQTKLQEMLFYHAFLQYSKMKVVYARNRIRLG